MLLSTFILYLVRFVVSDNIEYDVKNGVESTSLRLLQVSICIRPRRVLVSKHRNRLYLTKDRRAISSSDIAHYALADLSRITTQLWEQPVFHRRMA